MTRHFGRMIASAWLICGGVAASSAASASYQHVLLISVDGMHAIDLANFVAAHPQSTLASLSHEGTVYPNALTTTPSDSFPGFLAQVTGGTPKSTGVFYDDSYDRTYFPAGSNCQGEPGTEVPFAEDIDIDSKRLDAGGTPGQPQTQIDPKKLPLALIDGKCTPIYPHAFNRVNTVFEIVKQHGGRTAWSDKHPAYEWVAGPSGKGLDDLFALEQDSLIPGTKVKTTGSFKAQRDFDEARVKAVLNELKGLDSTGATKAPVPQLFGLNFQAVSVGQKLPKSGPGDEAGLVGGYTGPDAAPGNALAEQLAYVDGALGELMSGLKEAKLTDSTLVIVSAKHGQSPIDPATLQPVDDAPYTKMPGYGFHIADDAALIWLKPKERAAQLPAALAYLEQSAKSLGIGQILPANALALSYNDPATDSRTPDFIVGVNPGVVYTSGKKIAEHGGMNQNDRSVMLLVSAPGMKPASLPALVQTTQIAPTILKALGYDPNELQAVRQEGTTELPGLPF
ncbi:alkaline phosphatase family protein [Lichenifustis flavocetrariae]|uniref:Alkaline phosphatase family protein n=1 Tax=Lichenifustis flavocetrariae TaxID=2949735 RepID=A0AA41YY14_9HYPH|nr:alkaline phosphatase family protein [Lichenifustis flavocetrariae]MCW6510224.1 alkaline phosphatase family protein [Lichenifustis flavocetrariae]